MASHYAESKTAVLSALSLAIQLNYLEYKTGGDGDILQAERTDMIGLYNRISGTENIGWIEKFSDCI